ncbi:M15 family metallopeptidase [Cyanobacterium sp. IPPAS B-1200]|uniref:M15 family metallopeptidase n=1 Tax=Cyanobacterium sp. IPPAS B-1200 TaxID=1562720 RepID=UPI0008526E35|nr:M15 family metallopeptidase [Cyanobacterium sp. IPPAS B-1200]OEJ78027.1 D-alanyl-D-alanine dipeptidase [Cyanobacterium sp. IPPAS B-1200]
MEKPYQKIAIQECGEALIAIPEDLFLVESPPPYQKLGADYGGKSPYYLRQSVVDGLIVAQEKLQRLKPQWRLKIFDAYRPILVQQFMVDYTFKQVCDMKGLNQHQLNSTQEKEVYEEVYKIWAIPSHNPLTPPPHSTGAAVDLTLLDEKGQEVDMGGEIDELSGRSHPNHYQHSSNSLEQGYHRHRQILLQAMEEGGFLRHPGEWWHFSQGDQMWAWLQNSVNPSLRAIAKYGSVE